MLISTSTFAQVSNIPTFVNEENCLVMKFNADQILGPSGSLGSDTIKSGKMYLEIQGTHLTVHIRSLFQWVGVITLTPKNFYLQDNILLLEDNEWNNPNSPFLLIVKLSDKDKTTFQKFVEEIPN